MAVIPVTPPTLRRELHRARPGDTVVLTPGRYRPPITLSGIGGLPGAPLIIRGEDGARIDGGVTFEAFEPEATRLAWSHGGFPGLYPFAERAALAFHDCRDVVLEGLAFLRHWPTLVYLRDCQRFELRGLSLRDGTFAVYAEGEATSGILVEGCHWLQDVTRSWLWRERPWAALHGRDPKVNGLRAFDGAFFRSRNIGGDVTIRGNLVEHAANGVQMFNRRPGAGRRRGLNNDVRIVGNRFSHIRDNPVEPERRALGWWVWDNEIRNCHKWFSLQCQEMGWIYIWGNRGWFDDVPGPPDDGNRGGGVLKPPCLDGTDREPLGPVYVFHNSWYLRSTCMKGSLVPGLQHLDNAIAYCESGEKACDARRPFFKDVPKDWRRHQVRFAGDVVAHPAFPDALLRAGYPIEDGIGGHPGFVGQAIGDLRLGAGSPARGAAVALRLRLPEGREWRTPPGLDAGALQGPGGAVLAGPRAVPIRE